MSRILDRDFKYTPARKQTVEHLKAVFAKERARLRDAKATPEKVTQMQKRKV